MTWRIPSHVGCGLNVRMLWELSKQRCFSLRVFQSHIDNEHRQQIDFACIKAALENMQLIDGLRVNA